MCASYLYCEYIVEYFIFYMLGSYVSNGVVWDFWLDLVSFLWFYYFWVHLLKILWVWFFHWVQLLEILWACLNDRQPRRFCMVSYLCCVWIISHDGLVLPLYFKWYHPLRSGFGGDFVKYSIQCS